MTIKTNIMEHLLNLLSTASFTEKVEQNDDYSSEKNDCESDDEDELETG